MKIWLSILTAPAPPKAHLPPVQSALDERIAAETNVHDDGGDIDLAAVGGVKADYANLRRAEVLLAQEIGRLKRHAGGQ
jgi:hypothetical protein